MSPEFVFDLLLKSTAIFAVGWAVTLAMGRASSASRHAVWAAVCVAALALPVAQLVLPARGVAWWPRLAVLTPANDLPQEEQTVVVPSVEVLARVRATDASTARTSWTFAGPFSVVWAVGVLAGVARFLRARRAAHRLTTTTSPVAEDALLRRAELIAAWLGVPRYELRSGPADLMPATWGTRAPVVVLPSVANSWPQTRLDPVLVHELAHVQRRDAAWLQLSQVMLAVWWMHPLAWVAARQLRMERERACDDLALAFGSRASDYASELVSLAGECGGTELTLAMARRSQLEGRVMAILNPGVNRDGRTRVATALAAVVVLAIVPMASLSALTAVLPPTPAVNSLQQEGVRVGGQIAEPKKIKHVAPVYPDIAMSARVQGVVIVEAVIGTDGRVVQAKVIRPVALLDQAALDAVYQWEFTPTLLNGAPVPVIMTLTVNFTLEENQGDARTLLADEKTVPVKQASSTDATIAALEAQIKVLEAQRAAEMGLQPAPLPTWNPGDPPLRIGGAIKEPKKIKHVAPVYPPEAQQARVQGIVILEVQIDPDGRVSNARVIRPVALLDQAALDAVLQWEFTPTVISGQQVPIIITVTVNFTLQ